MLLKKHHNGLPLNRGPIFEPVFGDDWQSLPSVMRQHYINKPFSNDQCWCKGTMTMWAPWWVRLFAPLMRLVTGTPLVNQQNFPTRVDFKSEENGPALQYIRSFHLSGDKPVIFRSRMLPLGGRRVAEIMKSRLCWLSDFIWQDERITLKHAGYGFFIFGKVITLPLTWMMGSVNAAEIPTSDNSFDLEITVQHPLFGKLYDYSGSFIMVPKDE